LSQVQVFISEDEAVSSLPQLPETQDDERVVLGVSRQGGCQFSVGSEVLLVEVPAPISNPRPDQNYSATAQWNMMWSGVSTAAPHTVQFGDSTMCLRWRFALY
jgi:hypothetical protein